MADDKSGKPPPLMGATAIRPPERVGAEKYTYIFYDPKNGTILTRTPKSWALIILFYMIYYSCLAAFWLACMKVFLTIQIKDPEDLTIKNAKPTWTVDKSIIGVNPGIGIRPSQPAEDVGTSIFTLDLKFDGTKAEGEDVDEMAGSKGYAHRADVFFKVFGENKKDAKGDGKVCGDGDLDKDGYRKNNGKFCLFDENSLSSCKAFPYGYGNANFQPCVFVKFNRIMDLKPKPIKDKNNVDESLKNDPSAVQFLEQLAAKNYPDQIFIKCEGEYPADKEALDGNLKVYPEAPGIDNAAMIPLKYFPYDKYRKGKNESPVVAVQFTGLKTFEGRLVHIICKAYYDGVVHSKKNKAGLVKFEMWLKTPFSPV